MAGSQKRGSDRLELYAKRDGTVGIKNVPRFRNEREEAEWWDFNSSRITDFAMEHGLAGKRPARGADRSISLRLTEGDLARARNLAEQKGLGFQSYIKMLVHEVLGREEKKLARGRGPG